MQRGRRASGAAELVQRAAALLVVLALALPVGTAAVAGREGIVICRDGAFVQVTPPGEPTHPRTGHDGLCCLLPGACCAGRDATAAPPGPRLPAPPAAQARRGRLPRASRGAATPRTRPWSRAPPPALGPTASTE